MEVHSQLEGALAVFQGLEEVYRHLGPETRVELVQVGSSSFEVDELGFPSCNGQVNGVSDRCIIISILKPIIDLSGFCREALDPRAKQG